MKLAILSSASSGGAGIAAARVKQALQGDSKEFVDFIEVESLGARLPNDCSPAVSMTNGQLTNTHFTVEYPGFVRGWFIDLLSRYDVLNIHWASGLIALSEVEEVARRGTPILFTCHDYYYFTGGCHYPAGCKGLFAACRDCPQIDRSRCPPEIVSRNLALKRRMFGNRHVHLAAPSGFIVAQAVQAGAVSAQKTHVLRNPYRPEICMNRGESGGVTRIALVADSFGERRKGMPLALESLNKVVGASRRRNAPSIELHVIGSVDALLEAKLDRLRMKAVKHGCISEHGQMADILASCDILLTCSFEDNWPNVLVEAGAYGAIPVVGPGHGCEEFVNECGAGFIAEEYSASSFASAILSAVESRDAVVSERFARTVRSIHDPARVASDYRIALEKVVASANGEER